MKGPDMTAKRGTVNQPDWEFDFNDDCVAPQAAAAALVECLLGMGIEDEQGCGVEVSAATYPEAPGVVYVWFLGGESASKDILDTALDYAYKKYFECRDRVGAKAARRPKGKCRKK